MPLKISPWYNNNDYSVWPEENNMVINQTLKDLKEQRNFANISQFEKYVKRDPDNSSSNIAVKETQIYKG